MPLPKPNKTEGESKKDFLQRCMGNPTSNKDFPDNKQRYAVCNSIWSEKTKKAKANVVSIGDDEYIFAEEKKKDKTGGRGLNKPFRTPNGPKKFGVYVKNDKGNIVLVRFGDKSMEIRRDDPERRRSFRARHKCDTRKDKTTSSYWSCRFWESGKSVTELLKGSVDDLVEDWDGETLWDQVELLAEFPELLDAEEVEDDQDI